MLKNRLLEIRLQKGYKKQKDFADFLEISQNQYNRYENNKLQPTAEVIYRICKKLSCNIDDLFYEEP